LIRLLLPEVRLTCKENSNTNIKDKRESEKEQSTLRILRECETNTQFMFLKVEEKTKKSAIWIRNGFRISV
jgi:hypothetical protein